MKTSRQLAGQRDNRTRLSGCPNRTARPGLDRLILQNASACVHAPTNDPLINRKPQFNPYSL